MHRQVSPEVQKATLEFRIAQHPAGKAAAQLQQGASKLKGQQGMALRQRINSLEEAAAGAVGSGVVWCHSDSLSVRLVIGLPLRGKTMRHP